MQISNPQLFIEINESNFIFIVCVFDDNQNLKIQEKIIVRSEGIANNRLTNIELVSVILKKNINEIEKKTNFIFRDTILILDIFSFSSINISGFKKLNGSQVLKENISYILNLLKSAITESEQEKTILHIFNSKSVLDNNFVDNLPIGLFGDFYTHELAFFLIQNNDLKNLKQVFNRNNIKVEKIIIKNFCEGVKLIEDYGNENFFKIKISENFSNISYFDNAAYKYSENFAFGSKIIFQDIEKVCSLDNKIVKSFLSENLIELNNLNDDMYLEEKFFVKSNYRKIRKKLVYDIAIARIEEFLDIIFNKNVNIDSFKKDKKKVFITINDKIIFKNFNNYISTYLSNDSTFDIKIVNNSDLNTDIASVANLTKFGWKKEAIPVAQNKKSFISRVFETIFH